MSRPRGVDEELRKLFIGGLGRSVTEEGFVEYFGQWGQMSDSVIIKDSNGQSKGFGFVTYETVEQTDTCLAVKKGKGHKLGGKDIEVKRAIPRDMSEDPEQTQKNTRMFIGGLGQDLCEDQIKSYFEDNFSCAVEVVDLIKEKKDSVPQGQTPRLRGFGFITFEDCDIVDKLCIMKSHEIDGRTVTVRKAAPRGAQGSSSRDSNDRGYGGSNNDRRGPRNDGYNGGNQRGNQDGYGGNHSGNYSRNQRGGYNQRCYEENQGGYGGNQGGGYGGNQGGGYGGNQGGGYGGNQGGRYGGNQGGGYAYGGNQGGGYNGNQSGGYRGNQGGGYNGNQGGGYGGNQGGGYGGNQGGGYGGNQGGGYGRQNNGGGPQRSNGGGNRGGYRPY